MKKKPEPKKVYKKPILKKFKLTTKLGVSTMFV
jgi:hypothetical protein